MLLPLVCGCWWRSRLSLWAGLSGGTL
jgi:hypothetical protein